MARFARAALLVGAVAAAVVPGLAPPAGARHTWIPPVDDSPVPALARKTIVEGSETGWLRVRLPEPVRLPREPAVVTGDGRLVALYLVEEKDGAVARDGAYYSAERFGWCADPGCAPDPYASTSGGARTGRDGRLPAGTYRLFLVADEAAASVTIELPGLSGATRLTPRFAAESELTTIEADSPVPGAAPFYSAGAKAPVRGRGIAFLGHFFEPAAAGAAAFGYCVYRKEAPADDALAYAPPRCHTSRLTNTWVRSYTPTARHVLGFTLGLDGIPAAMGAWHTAGPGTRDAVTVALWLKTG